MIHIFGTFGYIGREFEIFCKQQNTNALSYSSSNHLNNSNYLKFDLMDKSLDYLTKIKRGDIVYFFSAISSPEKCESEFEKSYLINVSNTIHHIKNILRKEVCVVFISSDVVYGMNIQINNELTNTNPFGKYAEMKAEVEKCFFDNPLFITIRLSYVFSEKDRFFNYLKDSYLNNKTAYVYRGLHRNVIYIKDVINVLYSIYENLNKLQFNVLNLVGLENLSRADMANFFKLKYKEISIEYIDTPKEILKIRPEKIFTTSIFSDKIKANNFIKYKDFILNLKGE